MPVRINATSRLNRRHHPATNFHQTRFTRIDSRQKVAFCCMHRRYATTRRRSERRTATGCEANASRWIYPPVDNLYQGMTLDAVTGLYDDRARDYSPSLGR
jgi:hypothetical protein